MSNLAVTGLAVLANLIFDFDLIWVVAVPLVVGASWMTLAVWRSRNQY